MMQFETAQLTVPGRDRCEDRVAVIQEVERTVIVVADGAGGTGHGDRAAETVIREVQAAYRDITSADQWERELRQIDLRMGVGESTAAIADVRAGSIVGASVGDSQIWIIHDGELVDLTVNQNRKPRLGSGNARPAGFSSGPLNGILIAATDGFCDYVKRHLLVTRIAQVDFLEIPRTCVEWVRLPSGELWDDIGIVACRMRSPRRPLRRHAI